MKEGVIKFRCDWRREPLSVPPDLVSSFRRWRSRLREEGLLGVLPGGVGFGNVSVRAMLLDGTVTIRGWPAAAPPASFLITGSRTGGVTDFGPSHLSLVT
jgi:L-ribulose-5-phosphate 4-epimerase